MKTAVIYSGQARTFSEVFANQWWHVLRKLPDPHFFVSVENDDRAESMTRLWEKFDPAVVHMEVVEQPQIPEPPADPKWLAVYPPSASPQAILRQFWSLNRAWSFFRETCAARAYPEFHLVLRIRPDLAFARFEMPVIRAMHAWSCLTPWWARWGGVNDRVALMGITAARNYFTTFDSLKPLLALGAPLHPETLLAASLEIAEIPLNPTLATEFITVRTDGTTVAASISAIDYAEYARYRR